MCVIMRVCIAASVGGADEDVVVEGFFGGILNWFGWNEGWGSVLLL
jgi:hypothetical protein